MRRLFVAATVVSALLVQCSVAFAAAPFVSRPSSPPGMMSAPVTARLAGQPSTPSPNPWPFPGAIRTLTGTAVLTGHVYGLDGAPIDQASVVWGVEAAGDSASGQATTSADGSFTLNAVPAANANGSIWCAPANGAFDLGRGGLTWPDPGTTTYDFKPVGLNTTLYRGGPWPDWPQAWVDFFGSDATSDVVAGGAILGTKTSWGDWNLSDDGDVPTLPGVYDRAAIYFWMNEGQEAPLDVRTGPGARAVSTGTVDSTVDMQFITHDRGWVLTPYGLRATTDGGATWATQGTGYPANWRRIDFVDADDGWVVGADPESGAGWADALAARTTNGGTTWTECTTGLPTGMGSNLLAVTFCDSSHGWAATERGTVAATTDGGDTWTEQSTGVTTPLFDITATDPTHAWAVGDGAAIVGTTDGGLTWQTQNAWADGYQLEAVDFVDGLHGWAVGANGLALATTDGGVTWSAQHPIDGTSTGDHYTTDFTDQQHGWIASSSNGVLATTDGGTTWGFQDTFYDNCVHICMDGPASGWVAAYGGMLQDTIDAGRHWGPKTVSLAQSDSQRISITKPSWPSGPAGATVTVGLNNFPAGWNSIISGYSDFPATAPVTDLGSYPSAGALNETATVTVPKAATPGYAYYIDFRHESGPLDLAAFYQVCRFKPSATRVRKGAAVTLSGVVPTKGHWGSKAGKKKPVYLFKRSRAAAQPSTLNPSKQGWSFVGKYTANGLGKFTIRGVKVKRATWYVVLYPGDDWYWPGYTGVVKVGIR
jgi:photosystem II stability/assembly factor-like uncharacterized protein